jgi:hypothetical protein
MQELQASTLELIKIISDCLVFNTHLKVCGATFSAFAFVLFLFVLFGAALTLSRVAQKLDLSGCEMKEVEVKLLAEALRVNSTLEYLNITWCNLGDAGSAALAGLFPLVMQT